jgi:hypothetical protein
MRLDPWQEAGADQIRACLRESDKPLNLMTLRRRCINSWTLRQTVDVVNELVNAGDVAMVQGCCIEHTLFALPPDE